MMRWVQAIWHRFEKIIRYLFCSIISTVFDVAIVWCQIAFAIFFATFLMGLVCADGLILWTEHLVSPFLPKGWAFLVSKGVSIVGPFFLMYFVRKYAFQKLESKRKGS